MKINKRNFLPSHTRCNKGNYCNNNSRQIVKVDTSYTGIFKTQFPKTMRMACGLVSYSIYTYMSYKERKKVNNYTSHFIFGIFEKNNINKNRRNENADVNLFSNSSRIELGMNTKKYL